MANENLEQWLHPDINDQQHQSKNLSLIQKLNISVDMASALNYLHTFCEKPIVHCDLKPSTILLHDDMNVHVGDFGLGGSFLKLPAVTLKSIPTHLAKEALLDIFLQVKKLLSFTLFFLLHVVSWNFSTCGHEISRKLMCHPHILNGTQVVLRICSTKLPCGLCVHTIHLFFFFLTVRSLIRTIHLSC